MRRYYLFPIVVFLSGVMLSIFSCKHAPFTLEDDDMMPNDTTIVDPSDTTIVDPSDTTDTGNPCDPDIVYFNLDILPLFISNCAVSGCHDATTAQNDVILNSYDNVIQTAEVAPFDLEDNDLYERITDDDVDEKMPPPPNTPLTSTQINLIAKWILQGTQSLDCNPGTGGCDIIEVSYSASILPVIQNNCLGCHSGANPAGNRNFTTHAGVADAANSGILYGAIAHLVGFVAMPLGGNRLPQCTIDQFKSWIDAGAPDN